MQNQSKCKVTERLSLPELKTDVLQILHARGAIQVEHADRTGEGIRVEGILHLSFLYLRGDDAEPYGSWQGMIPFEHQIECKRNAGGNSLQYGTAYRAVADYTGRK